MVVSTLTIEGADEAIKSLELGAFDFVTKPNNIIEAKGNQFKETLLRVVYAAVRITPAHSASRNLTVVEKKAGAIVNKHKAAGSSANADVINHTHEILKLYKSGKSNVEIAKLLSLGTGEVKLIIDLYKEGK